MEVNPDEEKIYLQLGENYIRANDYDKAANIYGQMKSRFSENSVKAEEMAVASAEYARSSKMAEKTHEEQALYSKKSDSFAGFVAPSAAFESGANGYTKERYDFEEDKKKAKEEILASLSYFENKQYEKGFQSFYENYSRYADVLDDGLIEETIKIIKKYNEEIKNTNKKLYRKNLKKFKELEI